MNFLFAKWYCASKFPHSNVIILTLYRLELGPNDVLQIQTAAGLAAGIELVDRHGVDAIRALEHGRPDYTIWREDNDRDHENTDQARDVNLLYDLYGTEDVLGDLRKLCGR